MTLHQLPTEVIELITTYLDLPSFCNIRLTCSTLNQQTLHHFRTRFFNTQRLSWTKASFDRLLAISSHPSFGSNTLHHLLIDATPHHSISTWRLSRRLSEAQAIVSDTAAGSITSTLTSDLSIVRKTAEDDATFFNESRYDRKILTTVFASLAKTNSEAFLQSLTFAFDPMDRKYSKFGRRYCESSQNEMSRAYISTFAAIASSGIKIKHILFEEGRAHGALAIGRLESLAPQLHNFDSAFSTLTTLSLNLRDWRYPDSGFELDDLHRGRAPFVIRFLSKASHVKRLEISCYSSLEDDLFGSMAQHCAFPLLETCILGVFRINRAADLFLFLQPSAHSLRHLSLTNIRLTDESSTWPFLLTELASAEGLHVLKEFSVKNLFTQFGSKMFLDGTHTKWTYETSREGGKTWRQMLGEQVGGLLEGGYGPAWHLSAVAYPFVGVGS